MNVSDKQWGIPPNKALVLQLAKRELAMLVCDAVNLEGINYTLPEIQTLLQGVTVGGHKLSDQQIATNQADAWRFLFDAVEQGEFRLDAEFACQLHGLAAKEEALEWGRFRTGSVTIAGTDYMPPEASALPGAFSEMVQRASQLDDVYEQAITVFLQMARNQFFYDVNKRMGRFMMNGVLLDAGYPAINLPAARQVEFNDLMLAFYESGEQDPMVRFMRSCLDPRVITIMQRTPPTNPTPSPSP